MKTLAIDFDGVVHDYQNPLPGKRMGAPMPGAEEALETLYQRGFKIVIHTVKAVTEGGREAVEQWLDYYGLDYHEVTASKPNADVYIDDKAIKHHSWQDTKEQLQIWFGIDLDD